MTYKGKENINGLFYFGRKSWELNKIFPTIVAEDIRGMKYLNIFVNTNNCIPAVLGQSMQESFSDLGISRLSICLWKDVFLERLRKNVWIRLV
jgi:hypothetical protein